MFKAIKLQEKTSKENYKPLRVCSWNFNGFRSSKAQRIKQTGCDFFAQILARNDLVCFLETWRDKNDTSFFNLDDDFSEFHELGYRNHLAGRSSGGSSLLVRKSVLNNFSILSSDSYHFWCRVKKND